MLPGFRSLHRALLDTGGVDGILVARRHPCPSRPTEAPFHDNDAANQGGQYRTTAVDIEATTDSGGGYNVGWFDAGEWLEYTVNVPSAGDYTLTARVATNAPCRTARSSSQRRTAKSGEGSEIATEATTAPAGDSTGAARHDRPF